MLHVLEDLTISLTTTYHNNLEDKGRWQASL